MVVGNGMIARRFENYASNSDIIIFASGVSNSKNKNASEYVREKTLLLDIIKRNTEKKIIYFSTCSIYDPTESDSQYVKHKLEIESIITENCSSYLILRVPNLVGNAENKNTVLNFFAYHIKNKINFDLWVNATRNLVDIDDMFIIIEEILKNNLFSNQIINIANTKNYSVVNIVNELENHLSTKANFISIVKGADFTIDISLILPIIIKSNIKFDSNYLANMIKKYYK